MFLKVHPLAQVSQATASVGVRQSSTLLPQGPRSCRGRPLCRHQGLLSTAQGLLAKSGPSSSSSSSAVHLGLEQAAAEAARVAEVGEPSAPDANPGVKPLLQLQFICTWC